MLETNEFYYLIDLHYSQTTTDTYKICSTVLLPYRFTLFSNALSLPPPECFVLLPYRFTLFSNWWTAWPISAHVLLPYRFTLFSNEYLNDLFFISVLLPYRFTLFSNTRLLFRCLKLFYYLIDLHYSQTYSFAHFSEANMKSLRIV